MDVQDETGIKEQQFTWTWRLFKAAWTALNVLSAKDGETLREWGWDGCVARWGETERGERSLENKKDFIRFVNGSKKKESKSVFL